MERIFVGLQTTMVRVLRTLNNRQLAYEFAKIRQISFHLSFIDSLLLTTSYDRLCIIITNVFIN